MKNILIIGMGEFGKHIAKRLVELGNEVCIVDSNPEIINVLQNDYVNAYIGDCMQKVTLKELGAENFDICVVAIGQSFQASLEVTSHLKELGAKYIISKANSDIQSKFLLMAGADETIYPEKDSAEKVAARCNAKNLFDYIPVADHYSIFEIKVLESWINKTILELKIRNKYDVNIIAIINNGVVSSPQANYIFQKDDHVYLFGNDVSVKKLVNMK